MSLRGSCWCGCATCFVGTVCPVGAAGFGLLILSVLLKKATILEYAEICSHDCIYVAYKEG